MRTFKVPGSMQRGIGPPVEICGNSGLPFAMVPSLHQSNTSKWSYGNGELNNVIHIWVQKAHLAVRTFKVLGSMQRRIGPPVGICWNSGLFSTKVPWLHQCNVYIKRKLRVCRTQKWDHWVGATTAPSVTWPQSTGFMRRSIVATMEISSTFRQGTVIAPMQCLY